MKSTQQIKIWADTKPCHCTLFSLAQRLDQLWEPTNLPQIFLQPKVSGVWSLLYSSIHCEAQFIFSPTYASMLWCLTKNKNSIKLIIPPGWMETNIYPTFWVNLRLACRKYQRRYWKINAVLTCRPAGQGNWRLEMCKTLGWWTICDRNTVATLNRLFNDENNRHLAYLNITCE